MIWARQMTPYQMLGVVFFQTVESVQGGTWRWRVTLSAGWSFEARVEDFDLADEGGFVLLAKLVAARVRAGAPPTIPTREAIDIE